MLESIPHPADLSLAERCLEGEEAAILELQRVYGPIVSAYLVHRGASATQAHEITENLWADCLTPRDDLGPRLATYSGDAPLSGWLKTVALNRLVRIHFEERRRAEAEISVRHPDRSVSDTSHTPPAPTSEAPLIILMRTALEVAFRKLPSEQFVILQLAHSHQLRGEEIGRLFGTSSSTISRRLAEAEQAIAEETMRYIRQIDPLIDLTWDDFVELCRVACPSCFGAE